jgi:hypothetical protein
MVELYTCPPKGTTVICADELGPVIPRTFPPAPGWSPDGHRIKAPLEYSRGPAKTWVYGGLRIGDGRAVTITAPSRCGAHYQRFLQQVEEANPSVQPAPIPSADAATHAGERARLPGAQPVLLVFALRFALVRRRLYGAACRRGRRR